MTKRLKVVAIVVFLLAIFGGTVSAYTSDYKNITVVDGDKENTYSTSCTTVEEFLAEQDITLDKDDNVSKSLSATLNNTDTITITRAPQVIINLDGVPRMVTTTKETVGELLDSIKDTIDTTYRIENVSENTPLSMNMVIDLVSTYEKVYTVTEEIPFETITRENASLEYGIEKVVQEGSAGVAEITMKDVYEGEKKTSSEEVERVISKEAVNTIIEKGTSKTVATAAGNFSYKKALNVTATGYTPYDPGCTGTTASGTQAEYGVIAVDPRVIPMGSRIYIPGYGEAVAEDTGGAIKGNKIDLCYNTKQEAYNWGVRNITVYILE